MASPQRLIMLDVVLVEQVGQRLLIKGDVTQNTFAAEDLAVDIERWISHFDLVADTPQESLVYQVAVHYFNDHGYRESWVTVRIYIDGVLRLEEVDELMEATDWFWEVAEIAWPSGEVTFVDRMSDSAPAGAF